MSEMPQHLHIAQGSKNPGDTVIPDGGLLGEIAGQYGTPSSLTSLEPSTVTNVGGSQAHTNIQPFLTLNICIALQGIFPSQN
jgi:microcystin-dependent protein